jgi:hypothetical protein
VKTSCGCELQRAGSGVCSLLSIAARLRASSISRAASFLRSSFKSRIPECQSGDAGASPADRTQAVNTAGASSAAEPPKLCGSGAAPERRATAFHFQNRLRGGQVGRQRPHKPSMSGFDSRLRYHFQSHSTQQRAARSVRRSLALQARERGAKPRRSTIFQTREGWESTESHKLCHRGSSPRPATL